jgi:hypothetical protein
MIKARIRWMRQVALIESENAYKILSDIFKGRAHLECMDGIILVRVEPVVGFFFYKKGIRFPERRGMSSRMNISF